LTRIRAYILEESKSDVTAKRSIARLLDACDALYTFPERFPRYPYARDWRMMPFGNYLVFFRIHEEAVRIGHVRHAARRPFRG
jgi:plasmid stabilization system protein ParE